MHARWLASSMALLLIARMASGEAPKANADGRLADTSTRVVGEAAASRWFDPIGVAGMTILASRGELPDELLQGIRHRVGTAPLVILGATAPGPEGRARLDRAAQRWRQRGFEAVAVIALENRQQANAAANIAQLEQAGMVWLAGPPQLLAERLIDTEAACALAAALKQGRTIGASGARATLLTPQRLLRGADSSLQLAAGMSLVPDLFLVTGRSAEARNERWQYAAAANPTSIGVDLDSKAVLVVSGRHLGIVGEGTARLRLAKHAGHAAVAQEIAAPKTLDYTAWRRAARQRAGEPFPPAKVDPPEVPTGALVIVGGGGLPPQIVERFLELAGGPDAPLVVLPTAMPAPLPKDEGMVEVFRRAGARRITVLAARTRSEVESEQFAATLREARGVWLGGGRQWRFVDAYAGTRAEPLLHDVLARGGVIGGSSAGASIQAEYLVRGNPLGNEDMMALGYERGFGFLPGTAVDQHFTQRNRFADLAAVVRRHPQFLGIGIDEATALIVQGSVGAVMGRGAVHFCTATPDGDVGAAYHKVPAGEAYDLKRRQVLDAVRAASAP